METNRLFTWDFILFLLGFIPRFRGLDFQQTLDSSLHILLILYPVLHVSFRKYRHKLTTHQYIPAFSRNKMNSGRQFENGVYNPDYYQGTQSVVRQITLLFIYFDLNLSRSWNMMPQHQIKEQQNALVMNKKIMSILAERDTALKERNEAVAAKKEALAARDEALHQRDKALSQRDHAIMETASAFTALQYRENNLNYILSRASHIPVAAKTRPTKRKKESKQGKKVGEDLNHQVTSPGKKCRKDWESNDVGLNIVRFDERTMPVPMCSCTGTARQCYKWGNGGWQSSCCTTRLSQYPLPQMPNKRHSRVGGRKMSGSVYSRLLSRLGGEGHELSTQVDLKEYWARHGTNRYITIK